MQHDACQAGALSLGPLKIIWVQSASIWWALWQGASDAHPLYGAVRSEQRRQRGHQKLALRVASPIGPGAALLLGRRPIRGMLLAPSGATLRAASGRQSRSARLPLRALPRPKIRWNALYPYYLNRPRVCLNTRWNPPPNCPPSENPTPVVSTCRPTAGTAYNLPFPSPPRDGPASGPASYFLPSSFILQPF